MLNTSWSPQPLRPGFTRNNNMIQEELNNMDVVILCGGLGKRLRNQIGESQKVMAQVKDRPFLDILLGYLKQQGLRRFILCTGYKSELVEEYYKVNNQGLEIIISKEESPLGTGGAIKNAISKIKSDRVFALNGDVFCAVNYAEVLASHQKNKALATLVASKIEDARDYGTIVIGSDGRIQEFLEKQQNAKGQEAVYVNAGIYCFEKKALEFMPLAESFSIEKEFFPLLTDKEFFAYKTDEAFHDIGTPERYKIAEDIINSLNQ